MIEQLNIEGRSKVEQAIYRLKKFEPAEGYHLAFSGGKDSVTIKALADMAGVKCTWNTAQDVMDWWLSG